MNINKLSAVTGEEIAVRFSDLRRLASSVPNYLALQAGAGGTPTLRTVIEDDLCITGDDIELLITDFAKKISS